MIWLFGCQNYTIYGIFSKKKKKKYSIELLLSFIFYLIISVSGLESENDDSILEKDIRGNKKHDMYHFSLSSKENLFASLF